MQQHVSILKDYTKWTKLDMKDYIVYASIYLTF